MAALLAEEADVVGLQEVVPGFADAIRRSGAAKTYAISPNNVGSYGCLLLVRKSLAPEFFESEFPTSMGRSLIWAELTAAPHSLAVGTVHLESLDSESLRAKQLAISARALAPFDSAALIGDFNFDATRSWGDWRRSEPARGRAALENTVTLRANLPGWVDSWAALRPEDPGLTFDGEANPACVRDPHERMRYDRVMTRGAITPRAVTLLGTEAIDEHGRRPSDHFGVACVATVGAPPRDCAPGTSEGN